MGEVTKLDNRRETNSTLGTFEISVKFMQNSTWQGQIHWIEKNQKQNFRSALEMLKLMDEALAENSESTQVINWWTIENLNSKSKEAENREPQPYNKRGWKTLIERRRTPTPEQMWQIT